MGEALAVSFCATNLNTGSRLPASLDSVRALGAATGQPFEIVVADGPSEDGARKILENEARSDPRVRLVTHGLRNRGHGRRKAFEASRGTTVVPFDTSLAYAPRYGELLRRYLALPTEAMLFSEVCALRRSTIEAVGGWRDLVGGEDLDLYGRIIEQYGVVAFPTALRESQSERLSSYDRQMRYVRGSRLRRARRIYEVQRDQIIGANYRVRDLMDFNRGKPAARRAAYRLFFTGAAIGARLSPLKPFAFGRNNYLILREETFRSMLEGRHSSLGWGEPGPKLLLSQDEVDYLERDSALWAAERARIHDFYEVK
jgi:glycosyltransferase involved in cell wall biosynthesis